MSEKRGGERGPAPAPEKGIILKHESLLEDAKNGFVYFPAMHETLDDMRKTIILEMFDQGGNMSEIARALGESYQSVRKVVVAHYTGEQRRQRGRPIEFVKDGGK